MARKRKQKQKQEQNRRVLRSNSSTYVVSCINCDVQYHALDSGCPECSVQEDRFLKKVEILRPLRGANFYTDTASNSESFPLFIQLTYELRAMIWKEALSEPRVVSVLKEPQHPNHSEAGLFGVESRHNRGYTFRTRTSNPLLYVYHESYDIACSYYTKAFQSPLTNALTPAPHILFNFDTDILYFDMLSFNECSGALRRGIVWVPDFKRIKHLAILTRPSCVELNSFVNYSRWTFMEKWLHWFLRGGVVETVTMVHRRHPIACLDDLVLIDIQDIENSLAFYEQPYDQIKEQEFISLQHNYKQEVESLRTVDLERVQHYPITFVEGGPFESLDCEMPIFEEKLMTTGAVKRRLDRAREEFERKKAEYMNGNPRITTVEE
ncbi:hypothetical protein NHQ30_003381 [Ciborinia camelliae]|nr:hypothetical protein NHQ30_003381 [Ciborinia camelliae]